MRKVKLHQGLVHVNTGDGKGKTTAALGVAFRALGWGLRVCMVQFIKGYPKIGELMISERFGDEFVVKQFAMDITRDIGSEKVLEREKQAEEAMSYSESVVSGGEFDVIILDEINNAMHYKLIDPARVLEMMSSKPKHVELILTGRYAPAKIIEAADYVTEMHLIKHPYEKEIPARHGIDY
jgi:cob(I)alamin adenosyltransferase